MFCKENILKKKITLKVLKRPVVVHNVLFLNCCYYNVLINRSYYVGAVFGNSIGTFFVSRMFVGACRFSRTCVL